MQAVERFLKGAEEMESGYLFAMFTDRIVFEEWPLTEEMHALFRDGEEKLLEARIFTETAEHKLFRGDIGRVFGAPRVIDDRLVQKAYFDEEQYLDIDEKRSEQEFAARQYVRATGGGAYHLPISDYRNVKIRIRNYIDYYEETGQAYISDWRLLGIYNEKRER